MCDAQNIESVNYLFFTRSVRSVLTPVQSPDPVRGPPGEYGNHKHFTLEWQLFSKGTLYTTHPHHHPLLYILKWTSYILPFTKALKRCPISHPEKDLILQCFMPLHGWWVLRSRAPHPSTSFRPRVDTKWLALGLQSTDRHALQSCPVEYMPMPCYCKCQAIPLDSSVGTWGEGWLWRGYHHRAEPV